MNIETARHNMVERQLRGGSVLDARALDAFLRVPREKFVPSEHSGQAFADMAIPLPCGQRMMSPRDQGLLLQSLAPRPGERILEVGTGSGFLAACMRHLGASVDSLELHPELAEAAGKALASTPWNGEPGQVGESESPWVSTRAMNAWSYQTDIRYDAVSITASMPDYDPHFERWLKPEGRLFVVVGRPPVMEARLVRQHSPGKTYQKRLFELDLDPIAPPSAIG